MQRLGGWVRLGIVASVLWAIGAFFYFNSIVLKRASDSAAYYNDRCYRQAGEKPNPDYSQCRGEWEKGWKESLDSSKGEVATLALAPIPVAWLFVWLTVVVFRWVRAGFR